MSAVTLAPRPVQRRAVSTVPRRRPTAVGARRRRVLMIRRLIAAAVVAAVVVSALGAWALHSQAADTDAGLEAAVVVAPGETVWDIAADYVPPGQSTHAYVAQVLEHNAVEAASVQPGTVLRLPRP